MRPWLFGGDEIDVAPCAWPPRRGAIVLLARGERLYAHRVRAVRGSQALTRGDLSGEDDGWWGAEALLGEVVRVRPGPRWPWRPPLDLRHPSVRAAMRASAGPTRLAWRALRAWRAVRDGQERRATR
jgi:hypothetical protein